MSSGADDNRSGLRGHGMRSEMTMPADDVVAPLLHLRRAARPAPLAMKAKGPDAASCIRAFWQRLSDSSLFQRLQIGQQEVLLVLVGDVDMFHPRARKNACVVSDPLAQLILVPHDA